SRGDPETLREEARDASEQSGIFGAQEEVPPPAIPDPFDRTRGGSDDFTFLQRTVRDEAAEPRCRTIGGFLRGTLVPGAEYDVHEAAEGRIEGGSARVQLQLGESGEIMIDGPLDGIVVRERCLNDHLATLG